MEDNVLICHVNSFFCEIGEGDGDGSSGGSGDSGGGGSGGGGSGGGGSSGGGGLGRCSDGGEAGPVKFHGRSCFRENRQDVMIDGGGGGGGGDGGSGGGGD